MSTNEKINDYLVQCDQCLFLVPQKYIKSNHTKLKRCLKFVFICTVRGCFIKAWNR